jgi:hypothetical protein
LLYGTKWEGAAPVLSLLFLSVPLQLTWCMTTPVLWNNHRKHYEFIAQLPVLAASAYGFYAFAGRGVEAAALVAVGSTLLRSIVLIGVMMPGAHIRLGQIFGRFGRGAWLCALFGVAAWGGSQAVHWGLDHPGVAANWAWTHTALASHVIAPLAALAGGGGIAGLLGLALLLGRPQVFGSEAQQMLVRFVPRLSRLSKWLPVPLTPAVSTPRS